MSHELGHENDGFLWENQSWANISNNTSDNSSGEKGVVILEETEENEKSQEQDVINKEKKLKVEKMEGEGSEHDIHIWTERKRRKKMRNMFSDLHSLLPELPSKADKSTIVGEAINSIKSLESTMQRLQKQKLERLQGGPSNSHPLVPSVVATSRLAMLSGRETFMANQVSSMNNSSSNNISTDPRLFASSSTSHLPVFIQTWTSANVVLNICGNDAQFSIYALKKPGLFTTICCVLEKYKVEATAVHISTTPDRCMYMIQGYATEQLLDNMTVEEIYKQAAGEIMLRVTS